MLRLGAVRDGWVVPGRKASDAVIGYAWMYAERRMVPVKWTEGYAIGAVNSDGAAGSSLPGADVAEDVVEGVLVAEHWERSAEYCD